jgi:hypothetical protein
MNPRVRVIARKIKRGLALLWALGLAACGANVGIVFGMYARQSDAALLKFAKVVHHAKPASASDARDFVLMMVVVGVVLMIWGLHKAREWFRPL